MALEGEDALNPVKLDAAGKRDAGGWYWGRWWIGGRSTLSKSGEWGEEYGEGRLGTGATLEWNK